MNPESQPGYIIGVGLGLLLRDLLSQGSRPQIRVSGFQSGEIAHALKAAGLHISGDNPALVMVSGAPVSQLDGLLASDAFTANGRTATYGRNHNTDGFVYFQTSTESDSQSTKAMFPIRDSSFFEGERWLFLLQAIHPKATLEAVAPWRDDIRRFVDAFMNARRLPLRPFAAFLAHIGRGWKTLEYVENLPRETRAELISSGLPEMRLFRYQQLSESIVDDKEKAYTRELRNLIYGSSLTRPSGSELDPDQLVSRLKTVRFDEDPTEDERLKQLTVRFLLQDDYTALREVDFSHFSQCLRPIRGVELGTAVHQYLRQGTTEERAKALTLFDENNWESALNEKDEDAAQEVIDTDEVFLVLPRGLQQKIQRLLPREDHFDEPLYGIIETIDSILDEDASATTMGLAVGEESPALRGLFSFLYGPLLRELKERLEASGLEVTLDPVLSEKTPWVVPEVEVDDEDEDDEENIDEARDLSFSLTVNGTSRTFRWRPEKEDIGLLQLWVSALCSGDWRDAPGVWNVGADLREVDSVESMSAPGLAADVADADWVKQRSVWLRALAEQGLLRSVVDDYVREWGEQLVRSLSNDDTGMLALLRGSDCVEQKAERGPPERVWMLGCHPLRLRWLVAWRDRLGRYIESQLKGKLDVSRWNSAFMRKQMGAWSAHRYPPVLSLRPGLIHVPVEERGWCEAYQIHGNHAQVSSDVDPAAVRALVKVANDYVETRPHKNAGLHILMTVGKEAGMAREFIRQFSRKRSDTRLTLHLVAPEGYVEIDSLVEAGHAGTMMKTGGHSHFPLLEVRHHISDDERELPESLLSDDGTPAVQLDIAVVPFLFSGERQFKPRHDNNMLPTDEADPVLERPQTPTSGDQTDLVIELRPPTPDRILYAWADATTRSYNKGRISNESMDGLDYLQLHGEIGQTARRFEQLRKLARQVAIIDVGLTRHQLRGLPNVPEVVHVLTGLGKNGDYSLVVASDVVRAPLKRNLQGLLKSQTKKLTKGQMNEMAQRVVDNIGHLAPDLALKAVDRSAYAAELLGRHALRIYADKHHATAGDRFWVGLDAHQDWFIWKDYPDMMRVTIQDRGGRPHLEVLACESRFSLEGGAEDGTTTRLNNGVMMLQDVFGKKHATRLDQELWTMSLARALDDAWALGAPMSSRVRADIVKGNFTITPIKGLGVVWRMSHEGEPEEGFGGPDTKILTLGQQHLVELLGGQNG